MATERNEPIMREIEHQLSIIAANPQGYKPETIYLTPLAYVGLTTELRNRFPVGYEGFSVQGQYTPLPPNENGFVGRYMGLDIAVNAQKADMHSLGVIISWGKR